MQPAYGKGKCSRNSDQYSEANSHCQCEKNLPTEQAQAVAMSSRPTASDFASLGDNTVEQDEAHHAAYVREQYPKNYANHDDQRDQAGKQCGINAGQSGSEGTMSLSGAGWNLEIATITSSGTEFPG